MFSLLLGTENKEEGRQHQYEGQKVECHGNLGLEGHFVDVLLLEKLNQVFAVHHGHFVVETVPGKSQFFVFLE